MVAFEYLSLWKFYLKPLELRTAGFFFIHLFDMVE
jgi:hypothetical protein